MLTAAEYARIAAAADEVAGEIEAGTLVPGSGQKWAFLSITDEYVPWCSIGHIEDRTKMSLLRSSFYYSAHNKPVDPLRYDLLTVIGANDTEPRDVPALVAALRALAARARSLAVTASPQAGGLAGERRGE